MKKNIHPKLNRVLFVDMATGTEFPSVSTMTSDQTKVIEGEEYYVVSCGVTSDSHPAYTGEKRLVDTAGRIEKFNKRYAAAKKIAPKKKVK